MRRRTYLDASGEMKTQNDVMEVIEHRRGARQLDLGIPEDPEDERAGDGDARDIGDDENE